MTEEHQEDAREVARLQAAAKSLLTRDAQDSGSQAARDAVAAAWGETLIYMKSRIAGQPADLAEEGRLSEIWGEARSAAAAVDPDLAADLALKGPGWADPAAWAQAVAQSQEAHPHDLAEPPPGPVENSPTPQVAPSESSETHAERAPAADKHGEAEPQQSPAPPPVAPAGRRSPPAREAAPRAAPVLGKTAGSATPRWLSLPGVFFGGMFIYFVMLRLSQPIEPEAKTPFYFVLCLFGAASFTLLGAEKMAKLRPASLQDRPFAFLGLLALGIFLVSFIVLRLFA